MVFVLPRKFPCLFRIAFAADDDGYLTRCLSRIAFVVDVIGHTDPRKGGVSSMSTGRNVGSHRSPYGVGYNDQTVSVMKQILYDRHRN